MKTLKLDLLAVLVFTCSSSLAIASPQQSTMNVNGEVSSSECSITVPESVPLPKAKFVDIQNTSNKTFSSSVSQVVTVRGCEAGQKISIYFGGVQDDTNIYAFKNTASINAAVNVGIMLVNNGKVIAPASTVAAPEADAEGTTTLPFSMGYTRLTKDPIRAGLVQTELNLSIIQQ